MEPSSDGSWDRAECEESGRRTPDWSSCEEHGSEAQNLLGREWRRSPPKPFRGRAAAKLALPLVAVAVVALLLNHGYTSTAGSQGGDEMPIQAEYAAAATCAAIGCDKVDMSKSCLCTPRCSSHTPPNCCPDYQAVCALHPPAAGPGAHMWRKVLPGFNSEGVECMQGPLPVIWQHNAAMLPGMELGLLSYNLQWYNTFQVGNDAAVTSLIISNMQTRPFDVMGFQECEDEHMLLDKLGVAAYYTVFRDRGICIAFRKDVFALHVQGKASIAADTKFGKRAVQFLRLRHLQTGRFFFVVNNHGPIPVDVGGVCGGASVAYELLQLVKTRAQPGDAVICFGDFNANPNSVEISSIASRLHLDYSGQTTYGSTLDHVFSNIPQAALVRRESLGMGSSDHNAITVTYKLGTGPPVQAPAMALPVAPSQPTTSPLPPVDAQEEQYETEPEDAETMGMPAPPPPLPPAVMPPAAPQSKLQQIIARMRHQLDALRR